MPNHCCNTLFLNTDSLSLIVNKYIRKDENRQDIFDFERILQVGDGPDWYEQRLDKWGTNTFGYDLCIGESTIDFFTAWTPPIPIINKLAELHKDFVFHLEYFETGNAFRGIYTARMRKERVFVEDQSWNMTDKDFVDLGLV